MHIYACVSQNSLNHNHCHAASFSIFLHSRSVLFLLFGPWFDIAMVEEIRKEHDVRQVYDQAKQSALHC